MLTRDRGLLKHGVIDHGYLVRHTEPRAQLGEVVERFDLRGSLRPLTRCPVCNGLVSPVDKAEIADRLPPRTAQFYDEFWRCDQCGRVYWRGAHYRSLQNLIGRVAPSGNNARKSSCSDG